MDPTIGNLLMIFCFIVGSGLILMEAFMPGFGAAGICGIILEIAAVVLTATMYGTTWALIATFAVLVFIGIAIFMSYRSAVKGRLSKSPLVLQDTAEAPAPSHLESWSGKEGITVSSLRPAGFIEIGGERLNAATSGEFLEKGVPVVVIGAEGDHLIIRKR